MRISDWSSDVCSSDLGKSSRPQALASLRPGLRRRGGKCVRCVHSRRGGLVSWKPAGEQRVVQQRDDEQGQHGRDQDAEQQRDPETVEDRVVDDERSEEHTSELQSLMRISYVVSCLKKI